MKIRTTPIEGLLILEPKIFGDHRGFFLETYNQQRYQEAGIKEHFVQDNLSYSQKGVLRGLHFQKPHTQGKLVSVVSGQVWDVAVDLRTKSPTFGRWYGLFLDSESKTQFYVPPGFAHGFVVTSDTALFSNALMFIILSAKEVCVGMTQKSAFSGPLTQSHNSLQKMPQRPF